MTRAYSYLRFSTPEQERGDSFRRQISMAEAYASQHALQLDERSFRDLGMSAFRGANAETGMLGEFLNLVRCEAIPQGSFLLVESLDRLSRNKPRKAVRLLESICEEGITVVTLADGKVYNETTLDEDPMAFMWAFMVAMRANEESATKSRRLKAAWSNKRAKASERALTARAPSWLRLHRDTGSFEVLEKRAAVVRRIYAMALEGVGQHRIAETLNAEAVPVFGRGQHWHRSYVAKLLNNPAVIGTYVPHTIEYESDRKKRRPAPAVESYFPAIVERSVFEHVQAMARAVHSPLRGRHAAKATISNIFGGVARCPICDGAMTRVTKGRGHGRAYLVCAAAKAGGGCHYRAVPYDQAEASFRENVGRIVAEAPAGDDELDGRVDRLSAKIGGYDDAINNILEGIERGRGSMAERIRLRELEAERERLEREYRDLLRQHTETAGPLVVQRLCALEEAMRASELDRMRANVLLRQLFTAVVVDYRRGHLVMRWKHGGESDVLFAWPKEETISDDREQARA